MIDTNGPVVLNYSFTNLSGPDLTKIEGEEVWSVYALDGGDNGNPLLEGETLESTTLQAWPIADATFSGIDTVHAYEKIPTVTVTLNDLYPESTTFVRVYAGEPTADPEGPSDVSTSYVIIQDSIPQNRVLTLDDLDRYLLRAGT